MSGLVGCIFKSREQDHDSLIDAMAREIKYVESDKVDKWTDNYLHIARIHHGVVNPQKQPIFNEDGSLMIVMEGKIYDYADEKMSLIGKNHRFTHKNNDAEFCLHLYEELGENSFKRLNGNFLIAIYDIRKRKLIIANDRFSSYPLFYYEKSGCILFGSQMKALLQYNKILRDLDTGAIFEFFTFERVQGEKTYYKDIKIMFPASFLEFKNDDIKIIRYWSMNYKENIRKSEDFYIEALSEGIKKSVRRRTEDNLRYSILLSGGLDSRAVLAASSRPMNAYTIGCYRNLEANIAERVAFSTKSPYSFMQLDSDHYTNIAQKAVELGDGMYSLQHAHFIGFLDSIRNESDCLFTGHGLDILFTGYYMPRREISILNKKFSLPELYPVNNSMLSDIVFNKLKHSLWKHRTIDLFNINIGKDAHNILKYSVGDILDESNKHASDPYNRIEYFVYHFPLRHFAYLNALCIQHHLEQRVVVFDNDLFDLYLEIPTDLRFGGRLYKKAIQKINMEIMNIPNSNTELPPIIPRYVEFGITNIKRFYRKILPRKYPYPFFNERSWFDMPELIRHNSKLNNLIRDVINDEKHMPTELFNRSALNGILNKHMQNQKDLSELLFVILTFGMWHKKYGP